MVQVKSSESWRVRFRGFGGGFVFQKFSVQRLGLLALRKMSPRKLEHGFKMISARVMMFEKLSKLMGDTHTFLTMATHGKDEQCG